MTLSDSANTVISILEKNGYKAYLVGGAVRNHIMDITPDDIDIATNALPDETKEIFSAYKVIDTGIKHGTVTVLINGCSVEITTFRTEEGYSDGRHPDKVTFTNDIREDLRRRDFTINSIAYSPTIGLIDPFEGAKDINNKTIRCTGNPSERFKEDALRILRALRFSSVLGFSIEDETTNAIHNFKHLLKNISAERVYSELSKMLCGKNIRNIINEYADVIGVVIPEIGRMIDYDQKNYHHKYNLLEHTAVVVSSIPAVKHLRFAALLHDIAKPVCRSFDSENIAHYYKHSSVGAEIAESIMSSLNADNATKEKTVKLIRWHDTPIEECDRIIKRKLRSVGKDLLFDLIELQRADTLGLAEEYHNRLSHFDRLKIMTEEILSKEQCFSLKNLDINGHDMSALGLKDKQIGTALNFALEAVIDNTAVNQKDILIKLIKENADSF